MQSIEFLYRIVDSADARSGMHNALIEQLAVIESERSLVKAAKRLGVSYRHLWGCIEDWEARFGQKLVLREQGRPATLTPLGSKLLWMERSILARHGVEIEKLRSELSAAFAAACDPNAEIISLAGCFDPWLARLPQAIFPSGVILDLRFSTSLEGLKSLEHGEVDLAAFNFPRGSTAESSAARAFAPHLHASNLIAVRFSSRTQGLALAAGNPHDVQRLSDVVTKRLRFAGRKAGTGTRLLEADLLAREGLAADALDSLTQIEESHRMVAMAVAAGRADAGLCVETAAKQCGDAYVPLAQEDYLLVRRADAASPALERLLAVLASSDWRKSAQSFPGVDGARCGEAFDLASLGW